MSDQMIHALCAQDQVQVCAISGAELVAEARQIHGLSRVATAALGRQLMMTSMMGSRLKNEDDRVSTIIKGDGYAGSMVCTAMPDGTVKGCVQEPIAELPPTAEGKLDVAGYVGRTGKLTVVRDMGYGDPYVGVCNLVSGEIALDFAQYFTASEQQPSLVYLGVRLEIETGEVRAAGGMLVQPLPGCDESVIDALTECAPKISLLSAMLDDVMTLEAATLQLLDSFDPHIVAEYQPVYHCDCSRERIERALISVGAEELTAMIEEDHGAEVGCQFCNKKYTFDEAELRTLLAAAMKSEEAEEEE